MTSRRSWLGVGPSGLILAREDLSLARLRHDCLVSGAFRQSRLWRKVARILLVLVAAEGVKRRLVGPVRTGLTDLPVGVQAQMEADLEAACAAAVSARLHAGLGRILKIKPLPRRGPKGFYFCRALLQEVLDRRGAPMTWRS